MKTSSTATNISERNKAKDTLFKFYLKNQHKSLKINDRSDKDEKKESKQKKSCFSKWSSFWKLKGCSESPKENAMEYDSPGKKREPPKSLPLIRRSDYHNYGPLIHGYAGQAQSSNHSKLSSSQRIEDASISSFVCPPPLPLRQSLTRVDKMELNTTIKTTQSLSHGHYRSTKCNHLMDNFKKLRQVSWYWGPLTKYEAELLLESKANGVFLVRDSGHEAYVLSVSFRAGNKTYHTRVEHSSGKFSFWLNDRNAVKASNIVDFINQLIEESKNGHVRYLITDSHLNDQDVHHPMDSGHISVALLFPFSRFQRVQSLVHLCRFQILLRIRRDHIGDLRIPNFLKTYLQSPKYFVERIEDFV